MAQSAPSFRISSAALLVSVGVGNSSPSSIMPSMCDSKASLAKVLASSSVFPAVTQPGKSGKETP